MLHVTGKPFITVFACLLAILAVFIMPTFAWAQAQPVVSASLSASRIAFEEPVTLQVIARGTDGDLDTRALEAEFDIVGRSQSQQVRIVNGVNDSSRRWALQIMPRRTGSLTVPPVSVGGVASRALSLQVDNAPAGADRVLFVELEVDEPTPWVQQQVYIKLKIFYRITIQDYQVQAPEGEGVSVVSGELEPTYTEVRDGVEYRVLERRFVVFPQQSGALSLSPITLVALVPADPSRVRTMFSPTRRVVRRTEAIELDVQPRPPDVTSNWWLPSRSVSITEQWPGEPVIAEVGDAVSRRMSVRAEGVIASQLPDLPEPDVEGASIYVDEPEDQTFEEADGLVTERSLSWAVIPQQPGTLVLPSVEFEWFDTVAGVARVASLPERTIEVQAAAATETAAPLVTDVLTQSVDSRTSSAGNDAWTLTTPVQAPDAIETSTSSDDGQWRRFALIALAGWVLTGVLLAWRELQRLQHRRQRAASVVRSGNSRASDALHKLKDAARESDYSNAALAIQAWARAQYPEVGVMGLPVLARSVDDPHVAEALQTLDARLYRDADSSSEAPVDVSRIHEYLVAETRKTSAGKVISEDSALPSL